MRAIFDKVEPGRAERRAAKRAFSRGERVRVSPSPTASTL
jgi:hypothetical protein